MRLIQDLKLLFNLAGYRIFKRRFPAHVAISVTNRCNLKCSYCFARYNSQDSDVITTEKLLSLVDELHARGTRLINLTGGEPLIKKEIKAIVDHITLKKGIKCSISTNGLLLEDRIDDIKNVSSINISLDGNAEQHNRNRGEQSYEKILKAIEIAVGRKIPVSTCTVLNKDNVSCVDEIVQLARKMDFLAIFHIPYGRLNAEENSRFNPLSREELRAVLRKIIDYKNAGYPIYYSDKTHNYIKDWPYDEPSGILKAADSPVMKDFKEIPCVAGDLYCFIDANGDVYPCTVLSGQVKVLNFLHDGFQAAWDFLPGIRCRACSFFFQNELNLLLSLDIACWRNFISTARILRR